MSRKKSLNSSPHQKLLNNWSPCTACPLHKHTNRQVLYKGKFPAKILLIGEAPGKQENALGKPFVGRSGQLLDHLLQEAFDLDNTDLTLDDIVTTNIVSCVPWEDPEHHKGFRPPTKAEAAACAPRLEAIYHLTNPKMVFLAGKSAAVFFSQLPFLSREGDEIPALSFYHPSYLLRQGNTPTSKRRSLDYSKTLMQIRDFLRTEYLS